ncbi:NUDIX domain-containing protein [Cohnella lupini]|uniref:NUDIX domain-containing protein n=1 Tax=Cohnella lupini TaxID=1294267 RepID=A0A3D9HP79_9BACL|nr:NUDIX domain-containing protein [Cohnella lupini]RED51121.1 NUDIX domain-containing protein [Cohnella lupini]
MTIPLLRAEGIICNEQFTEYLVQCDFEESFYRFPGGGIEFGETAAEAISRELIEEYDLLIDIGNLALVNESIVEVDGIQRHNCTLIHWCFLKNDIDHFEFRIHNEYENIKLIWKSIEELSSKPVYPEGTIEILKKKHTNDIHHIKIRKKY